MTAGTQPIQADLPPETQVFWKAVATAFPMLSSLGSWGDRSHQARKSDHNRITSSGKRGPHAIDAMTADKALHARIVQWALLNRERFGITLIISRRQKWSEATGWKPRPYLGVSGHFDHVHMSNDGTPIPVAEPEGRLWWLANGDIVQPTGQRDQHGVPKAVRLSIAQVQELQAHGWVQVRFDGSVAVT